MRRGGGYSNSSSNNQTGSILHNGPHPHGPHQHQSQNRMGHNRIYHHQNHPHQNLQNIHGLQNLHNLQSQPQLVPYGHGHVSTPRPLSYNPSPPLQNSASNNVTVNSNQHNFSSGGGNSGGGQGLLPLSNYSGSSSNSVTTGPSIPGCTTIIGGDMPPVETVVARLETACKLLHGIGGNNTRVGEIGVEIQVLSEDLRRVGPLLETAYPEILDRVMSSMRDASAQPSLPPSLRLAIFELVELRASKWLLPSDSSNYYRQRRNINDSVEVSLEAPRHFPSQSSNNSAGASVVPNARATSGNFPAERSPPLGPSPIPSTSTSDASSTAARTAFREEVIIKNSDSGKVMGVRGRRVHIIEAISDTIISFEKVVPSAKERVLAINGYSQQSINMAKQLIQETIQRNSSPVFDGLVPGTGCEYSVEDDLDPGVVNSLKKMSTSDGTETTNAQRFSYSVSLGDDILKITGSNLQFVQEAKFALDDYFAQKYPELFYTADIDADEEIPDTNDVGPFVSRYDRVTLLNLSLVRTSAPSFQHLEQEVRNSIVLDKPRQFDPEKYCRGLSRVETCKDDS